MHVTQDVQIFILFAIYYMQINYYMRYIGRANIYFICYLLHANLLNMRYIGRANIQIYLLFITNKIYYMRYIGRANIYFICYLLHSKFIIFALHRTCKYLDLLFITCKFIIFALHRTCKYLFYLLFITCKFIICVTQDVQIFNLLFITCKFNYMRYIGRANI